jgi:hypothetical protein
MNNYAANRNGIFRFFLCSLAIDPITRKLNHEKLALRTAYLDNLVTVFHPLHCEKEKPE